MPSFESKSKEDRPVPRFDRASRSSRSPRRGAGAGSSASSSNRTSPPIGGGPGAGDASSGGGAGAGVAGGGTDLRNNPKPLRDADVERDRQKLFPEARTHRDDPL